MYDNDDIGHWQSSHRHRNYQVAIYKRKKAPGKYKVSAIAGDTEKDKALKSKSFRLFGNDKDQLVRKDS